MAAKAIWRRLQANFGNVRVDFCQPFSLQVDILLYIYYCWGYNPYFESSIFLFNEEIFNKPLDHHAI
jgi:hypothetical protein